MNSDSDTVEVTLYQCSNCNSATVPSYHDGGDCEAPVIYIDSDWRCSSCGTAISLSESCFECGHSTIPSRYDVPLDLSPPVNPETIEQEVHTLTNKYRSKNQVSTLEYSNHLSGIALQHSRDMGVRDYFSHSSPEGNNTDDRYRTHDHSDRSYGENIALRHPGPAATPKEIAESIVDGWMDSPGHRENILLDRFEAEGIGVYTTSDGSVYATQNFR